MYVGLALFESLLEDSLARLIEGGVVCLCDDSLAQQRGGIQVQTGLHLSTNLLVHRRLREAWLVDLIVAVAAIRNDVDANVRVELCAILCCELHHANDRLGIISIDVEDGGAAQADGIGTVDA